MVPAFLVSVSGSSNAYAFLKHVKGNHQNEKHSAGMGKRKHIRATFVRMAEEIWGRLCVIWNEGLRTQDPALLAMAL